MDRGTIGAIVGTIVHILSIGARTDNLPISVLDIPVDSTTVGEVFPSRIVIFQTNLPAVVVLGVGVATFIVTVKCCHHGNLNLCFEVC